MVFLSAALGAAIQKRYGFKAAAGHILQNSVILHRGVSFSSMENASFIFSANSMVQHGANVKGFVLKCRKCDLNCRFGGCSLPQSAPRALTAPSSEGAALRREGTILPPADGGHPL